MYVHILDGAVCSKIIRAEIATQTGLLARKPGLAVVLVGEDPASQVYVRNKAKAASDAGIRSIVDILPATATEEFLLELIHGHNADPTIDGYIVQLPLPPHINAEKIVGAIDPEKDVDGFHPENQGLLWRGTPRFIPATPRGIIELLDRNQLSTRGKRVVILGRSAIVGKPLAGALLMKGALGDATVTVAHSQSSNLPRLCREADILIAALGQAHFVTKNFVRPGAIVIDVGINKIDGKLCGDVDFEKVKRIASAITPVPGGIGPMTIAMLLQNTLEAAKRRTV